MNTTYSSRIPLRRIKISTIFILSIISLLLGCSHTQSPPNYQGYVEGEFVYIASPIGGRLENLWVHRGQNITAKMSLFVLESENESAAQRQANEQFKAAMAQLEDMKTGKRPVELDVVKAQIAQAVAVQKKSELQRKRDEAQFKIGGISEAQLEESRSSHASSTAKVQELRSQLEALKLPARADQIRTQKAQLTAARAALDQAAWKLNQKSVVATQSGRIFDTMYREGEWVPAGNPVVRLLPPKNVKIRFFVPETVVGALTLGQNIRIHCDGCKADISAALTYISTESEYTSPIIYSNETRSKLVYMVEAHPSLENAPLLHPGQPVAVTMQ